MLIRSSELYVSEYYYTEPGTLERLQWRNWLLLAGAAIVCVVGFAASVLPVFEAENWPWQNTQFVLFVGLTLMLVSMAGLLTDHERKLRLMRAGIAKRESERAATSEKYSKRLMALLDVSRTLGSECNDQRVFDGITKRCFETFDCDQVALLIKNPGSLGLSVRSVAGEQEASVWNLWGPSLTPNELRRSTVTLVDHKLPVVSATVVPIVVREELVGILHVMGRPSQPPLANEDLKVLEVFAENAGITIRHVQRMTWMRQRKAVLGRELQEKSSERERQHSREIVS